MPLQLELKSPARSLNKAYLKETAGRNSIEKCKQQLLHLLEKADPASSEDTLKDYITDFLKNTWYSPEHAITINKEKKDFSIHSGKSAKDPVAVIAEVKKLGSSFNEAFFISTETKNRLIIEDAKCEELIKPALRGKDLSKYSYTWKGMWLILIKQGWTNENRGSEDGETFFKNKYPSVYSFLKTTGETISGKGKGLFNRDDKGDYWWELRP